MRCGCAARCRYSPCDEATNLSHRRGLALPARGPRLRRGDRGSRDPQARFSAARREFARTLDRPGVAAVRPNSPDRRRRPASHLACRASVDRPFFFAFSPVQLPLQWGGESHGTISHLVLIPLFAGTTTIVFWQESVLQRPAIQSLFSITNGAPQPVQADAHAPSFEEER